MKRLLRPVMHRSILTLAALTLTMGALTVSTRSIPAVHAAPVSTITATIHDNWAGVTAIPPTMLHGSMQRPRYTLHVVGASFPPGAAMKLALFRLDTLHVLQRGATSVQRAYLTGRGHERYPNPHAGTFDYEAVVNLASKATPLRLWLRSVNQMSIATVTWN